MPFLKRMITAIAAIALIALGGSGTQSSNIMAQGTGVIALVVGIVILLVFGRMMWRAAGCLVTLLIIGGICGFILYAIGAFADGLSGVPQRLESFVGRSQGVIEDKSAVSSSPMLTESMPTPKKEPKAQKQKKTQGFNPLNYPSVVAQAKVIKGNVLQFYNGQYIRLFGIDAPDSDQTCANKQGRSYYCGRQAAAWLKSWLEEHNLKCHILNSDARGNSVAVCFLGQYDIAAALTNAGWAVATTEGGGIYKAYEEVANANRRGLWQGQFYRPSDWRNIKNRKAEIKLIKPKKQTTKEGLFGF